MLATAEIQCMATAEIQTARGLHGELGISAQPVKADIHQTTGYRFSVPKTLNIVGYLCRV